MGLDAMILVFWILSFKPTLSLSSFTFIKRLFSSSSLSAIRVVSSAYLRLLIFLLAILIPARASFSPEFPMMYSAYKLNKQGDNIQHWCTPFPIWSSLLFHGWTASSTWWTWVWVNSGSWWWIGRPGVLRFMGLQRVRHDWVTELNWTELLFHVQF